MLKRPAFYIDLGACTGCKTCMISCTDKHDLPERVHYRRVVEYTGGEWVKNSNDTYEQSVFAYYLSISCNHCEYPICAGSCPTTAMHKDKNGIVSVDHHKCVGCRYCEWACPYAAPQYSTALGMMTKCDFCRDDQVKGKRPTCVAACPTRALKYGEYEELQATYGRAGLVAPFPDTSITQPNLVFTPGPTAKPFGTRAGNISNPEEM